MQPSNFHHRWIASRFRIGFSYSSHEARGQRMMGFTGCLENIMCNAKGPSTPGLPSSLACDDEECRLPVCTHLGRIQRKQSPQRDNTVELNTVQGRTVCRTLFILATFLPVNETLCFNLLFTDTLQHSILSLGLRATQVGVAPTCFSNHFQYERASSCSPNWISCMMRKRSFSRPSHWFGKIVEFTCESLEIRAPSIVWLNS